jgi:hypothetical protein
MGRLLLYAAPPVLLWATVLGRLPAIRRRPNDPVLRAYWLALLSLAAAVTVLIPPVQLFVDRRVGVPHLALLVGQGLALGCACAAQAFLLYSSYPEAEADPKMRRQVWTLAGTLMAMATLFVAGHAHHLRFDLRGRDGTAWPVLLYWSLYLGSLGLALVNSVRLIWRWARQTDRELLRGGLRLLTAGAAVGLVYVGYDLVFLAASQLGQAQLLGDQQLITQGLSVASVLLIVVGFTMPAWGPRVGLPRLLRWARRYRARWRLYPLWRDLCQVVPDVALVHPTARWRDAVAVQDLGFALHRRVIELRDARLRLRPYLNPEVAKTATELGRQASLAGEGLHTVVVAASLAAAMDAKVHGRPPLLGERSASADPGGTDLPADLDSESVWWVKVATAFRSPLVRDVIVQHPQRATAEQARSSQGP